MNILSPLLSFYSVAFLVEIGLSLFRIKDHRYQSAFRLLPFLSMLLDTVFDFFTWLNPFSCGSCVQKFVLLFLPNLKSHLDLSIFFLPFCIVTALLLAYRIYTLLKQVKELQAIVQKGYFFSQPISNAALATELEVYGIKVISSDQIQMPMALYSNVIVLPTQIDPHAFEAIIAHEMEHIKWKDPLVRLFMHLVATLFWWIPLKSWMKRVEQEQEMACDRSVLHYGFDVNTYAKALLKYSKESKIAPCSFSDKTPLLRIKAIFDELPSETLNKIALAGLVLGFLVWFFCK